MAELRFVMWNCSGVLPTSFPEDKLHFLRNNFSNFDVLVLLETHHKDPNELPSTLGVYKNSYDLVHTEATPDDPFAGIIVLVDKRIKIIGQAELIKGRLLNLKLKLGDDANCMSTMYGYSGKNQLLQN